MQELYEFRVYEEFASLVFRDDEGKRLGTSIRKVVLDRDDPRFERVRALQIEFRARGDFFFMGWGIKRKYSTVEIEAAPLFQVIPTRYFEPEGEECGTLYDDTQACRFCGTGAPRLGPLILKTKRIPSTADIASSIASEIVVSERFVAALKAARASGFEDEPVFNPGRILAASAQWRTLRFSNETVRIVPPTVVGDGPFSTGLDPCECGDLVGLNLISELTVDASIRGVEDIAVTRQFVGVRRGVLRPWRPMLVSPEVRQSLIEHRTRGWRFEVVHVRESGTSRPGGEATMP